MNRSIDGNDNSIDKIAQVLEEFRKKLPDLLTGIWEESLRNEPQPITGSVFQYTRFETLRAMLGSHEAVKMDYTRVDGFTPTPLI